MGVFETDSHGKGRVPAGPGGDTVLIQGVLQMLGASGSVGGLAGLVQNFEQQGLGRFVSSWVSTGPNLPITPDQVQQGLGPGVVQELAQSAGLTESVATSALAGLLPAIIDRLTPAGTVPPAGPGA